MSPMPERPPIGLHVVHIQCPRCHDSLDLTIGNRHFDTWDALREGRVVTCDEPGSGCGLRYFARPILGADLVWRGTGV
jgi:hypothetical protein